MDPECVNLCNAINLIKGVRTFESCGGHGKRNFNVWLKCNNSKQLFPIIRQISRNYDGVTWKLEAELTDMPKTPVVFLLHSNGATGFLAYMEAEEIAKRIVRMLDDDNVMNMFNIKRHKNGKDTNR